MEDVEVELDASVPLAVLPEGRLPEEDLHPAQAREEDLEVEAEGPLLQLAIEVLLDELVVLLLVVAAEVLVEEEVPLAVVVVLLVAVAVV